MHPPTPIIAAKIGIAGSFAGELRTRGVEPLISPITQRPCVAFQLDFMFRSELLVVALDVVLTGPTGSMTIQAEELAAADRLVLQNARAFSGEVPSDRRDGVTVLAGDWGGGAVKESVLYEGDRVRVAGNPVLDQSFDMTVSSYRRIQRTKMALTPIDEWLHLWRLSPAPFDARSTARPKTR